MRKAAIVVLSGLVLLGLTACGDSEDRIKKDAEFIKICKDNGGDPFYTLINDLRCDMTPATKD